MHCYTLVPENATDMVQIEVPEQYAAFVFVTSDNQLYATKKIEDAYITVTTDQGSEKRVDLKMSEKDSLLMDFDDLQSLHPYINHTTERWNYKKSLAKGYYVTFSNNTRFESKYDYLHVYGDNVEQGAYTGSELTGKSLYITGSAFSLELVTDMYTSDYGFKVTSVVPDYVASPTPSMLPTPSILPTPSAVPTSTPTSVSKKIQIASSVQALAAGKSGRLKANVSGVSYHSSNSKYITVSKSGKMTAKKKGIGKTVTITVSKTGYQKAVLRVKVYKKAVTKMTAKKKVLCKVGKKYTLSSMVKVTPKKNCYRTLAFSLKNPSLGSIDGTSLKLKKKAKGKTVVVYAKAQDGSEKKCTLYLKGK